MIVWREDRKEVEKEDEDAEQEDSGAINRMFQIGLRRKGG